MSSNLDSSIILPWLLRATICIVGKIMHRCVATAIIGLCFFTACSNDSKQPSNAQQADRSPVPQAVAPAAPAADVNAPNRGGAAVQSGTITNLPGAAPIVAARPLLGTASDSAPSKPDAQIELPGDVDDVTVGGNGRYLLLTMRTLQKVVVLDVREAKVRKYVNVGSTDFLVAGGGTQFVIVNLSDASLEAWTYENLETPRLRTTIDMKGREKVAAAAMGYSSEGPLALSFIYDPPLPDQVFVELFNLSTLAPLKYAPPRQTRRHATRHSASGLFIYASPGGDSFSRIQENKLEVLSFDGTTASLTPEKTVASTGGQSDPHLLGFDARTIYNHSSILLPDGRTIQTPPQTEGRFSPAIPPHYWLRASQSPGKSSGPVEFLLSGSGEPLTKVDLELPTRQDDYAPTSLRAAKRVFYNATEKSLVVFPFGRRLFLKRYDLNAEIAKLDTDVLHVVSEPPGVFRPGKSYDYQIHTLSNRGSIRYRLESGPSGLTVSPDGRVEWQPPIDAPQRQAAIVAVSDRSGKSIFHSIALTRAEARTIEVSVGEDTEERRFAKEVILKLPAPADDFVVGAGGRYVLAPINALRQIAVIDVRERKLLKLLPIDDDAAVKVAAGATKFVVYSAKGRLSRWSLQTLEREATVPFNEQVASMCMGSESEGPLMLSVAGSTGHIARFIELNALKPAQYSMHSALDARNDHSIEECVAASADGSTFASWHKRQMDHGFHSFVVRGSQIVAYKRFKSVGPITPSPDGSILYAGARNYDARETKSEAPSIAASEIDLVGCNPAANGNLYLTWSRAGKERAQVMLHSQRNPHPILKIAGLTPPARALKPHNDDPFKSRLLLYIPAADAVVWPNDAFDSLVVHRFSLDEELAKLNGGYLFVTSIAPAVANPDTRFTYQVESKSRSGGVSFSLRSGPKGTEVSLNGLVTWDVRDAREGNHEFIIDVVDSSGASTAHMFHVMVEPAGTFRGTAGPVAAGGASSAPPPSATPLFLDGRVAARPRTVIPMPGRIEDLRCGGGRFLVGAIPTLRQLVIFDLELRKVVRFIRVDDDKVRFAVGKTKLVACDSTQRTLSRYDLATGELELSTPAPVSTLFSLAMGCDSEGPIIGLDAPEHLSLPSFFDLGTLKPIQVTFNTRIGSMSWSGVPSVSADGRRFVSDRCVATITTDKDRLVVEAQSYVGDREQLSSDGNVMYNDNAVLDWERSRIGGFLTSTWNFPAALGPFYVSVPIRRDGGMQAGVPALHVQGDPVPLLLLEGVELGFSGRHLFFAGRVQASNEFLFVPTAHAIVSLSADGDRVNIARFDLDTELAKQGREYFFIGSTPPTVVHPESGMEYQIDARAKYGDVKFRLVSGPSGMSVSATGLVSWKPPGPDTKEKIAIVEVVERSGKALTHSFKFKVDGGTPKQPAVGTGLLKPIGSQQDVDFAETPQQVQTASFDAHPSKSRPIVSQPLRVASDDVGRREQVRQTLKLPGSIDDVCVGGDGRFLIVKLNGMRQVAIVDVAERRIVKQLPIDDESFLIAAGRTKLVVAMCSKNIFNRYDLATGAPEISLPIEGAMPVALTIGSSSEGPIFAVNKRDNSFEYEVRDLRTFDRVSLLSNRNRPVVDNEVRSSADGRLVGNWNSKASSSSMRLIRLSGNRVFQIDASESSRFMLPSPDGSVVYTSAGIFSSNAAPLAGAPVRFSRDEIYLPAASGPLFLRLLDRPEERNGRAQAVATEPVEAELFLQGESSPLLTIADVGLIAQQVIESRQMKGRSQMIDKRLFLLTAVDSLVAVSPNLDELIIQQLHLDEELGKSSSDYLFVSSTPPATTNVGGRFHYQIEVKAKRSGLKFQLASGPVGLTVSPTGLVEWNVSDVDPQQYVVTKVSDEAGRAIYHSFRIRLIGGTKPEYAPAPLPVARLPIPRQNPSAVAAAGSRTAPPSATASKFAPTTTPTSTVPSPSTTAPKVADLKTETRKWTSRDGAYTLVARLINIDGDTIVLKYHTSETFAIKLDKLSADDQVYVLKYR